MSSRSNPPTSSPLREADDGGSSAAPQAHDECSPPSSEAYAYHSLNQIVPPLGPTSGGTVSPPMVHNALYYFHQRQNSGEIFPPLLDSSTSLSPTIDDFRYTIEQFRTSIEEFRATNDPSLLYRFRMRLSVSLRRFRKWFRRAVDITCYKLLLMPGLIRVACHYFFSRQVRRGIKYGQHSRQSLDLYLPRDGDGPKPVVAFVACDKSWGSLLAQRLEEQGILVASIHYRNIPGSTLKDMVEDASQGISYVCNRIAEYGGDTNRIYVVGQQIGAYLAACAILHQAIEEAADQESVTWRVSQLKRFIGLSGGYDLISLVDIFRIRGLFDSIVLCRSEGEDSVIRFSPSSLVVNSTATHGVAILPAISLFHGTRDDTIYAESSTAFQGNLQRAGVNADIKLYLGKSDTDLFVLDPMRGGRDNLFHDIILIIHAEDTNALDKYARLLPKPRLVPECMMNLAVKIDPFSLSR